MKGFFERRGDVLVPIDEAAIKLVASIKKGDGASLEGKRERNIRFHRLFFALLHFAFDIWEPPAEREYRGQPIQKDFDRFREEVLILAGHYEASYSLAGDVQLKARSISFAKCDEHQFRVVYDSVLNVVWERIFRHARFDSKEEVERVTNQLLAYG